MIVAVIQARMGSTRLKGKVMRQVLGRPVLGRILDRLRGTPSVDKVVIATSEAKENNTIRAFAEREGVPCFSGSERDLLNRLYHAVRPFEPDAVVRITADCPFVDPSVVGRVIGEFRQRPGKLRYVGNCIPRSYPDGLDVDLISFPLLRKLFIRLVSPVWRTRGITYFFMKHPNLFDRSNVSNTCDLSSLRWTLDYPQDMLFVRAVYRELYRANPNFGMLETVALLKEKPALMKINSRYSLYGSYRDMVRALWNCD